MKNTSRNVKLILSIIGICLSVLYWIWNNRMTNQNPFRVNLLMTIMIYPILCYSMAYCVSLILFKDSFEFIRKEKAKKINTIVSIGTFVEFAWMMSLVLLYLSDLFIKNDLVHTFFTASYTYVKTELHRHLIVMLGGISAFYTE